MTSPVRAKQNGERVTTNEFVSPFQGCVGCVCLPRAAPTLVLLVLPVVSVAQGQWDDWYVAPTIIYYDDDGDRKIDDSLAGGQIAFGRTLTEHLSAEVMLSYLDISGWRDAGLNSLGQKHLELGASLLAYPNRNWAFAPYFLVGVG